ncbi:MAG TPA: primosomal protein N' [Quisquiliibacterium sp.]|nr:primosomal protein N' [Quisquiliibacterium sp.]
MPTLSNLLTIARVALDVPGVDGFDYTLDAGLAGSVRPGSWVLVPWGKARRIGIVISLHGTTEVPAERLRPVSRIVDDAPAPDGHWLALVAFAARYYHRGIGEILMPAVPKVLRSPPAARARGSAFARARTRAPLAAASRESAAAFTELAAASTESAAASTESAAASTEPAVSATEPVALTDAQAQALAALTGCAGFGVHLLHGVTGSGKTEVYLRWIAHLLASRADAQVLLLVPEIALTPQLFGQIAGRFASEPVAVLHSGLPDADRAAQWLSVAEGRVRLVVGTRLAVLTPMPGLAGVVVDEEHDASYRQQEGVRYSARDLAVALASQRKVPIVLGSATPSLESWLAAHRGRYRLLPMPGRVGGGALPRLRIVDPRGRRLQHSLAPEVVEALGQALGRGEQSLVFINRRGYAPVLNCEGCGWLSRCEHCSAYRVLHRLDAAARGAAPSRYRLVCHHCSAETVVPRACPDCGNVDLTPLGRGTQRLEEGLQQLFPEARIARLDRDVARRRNAARDIIDAAHAGEVDILVGTQMLAKGHDFRRLTLVAAIDPDGGLYSSDFRAPERLFAVLMQVAGRAGRAGAPSQVIVQTRFPGHPLFAALARHDYAGFADAQLAERRESQLPPFMFQALLRAEARTLDAALDFLAQAKALAQPAAGAGAGMSGTGADPTADEPPGVAVYDPVPMPLMRLAGRERAQLLLESASRSALHAFLDRWLPQLDALRTPVRWQLEIDPLEI